MAAVKDMAIQRADTLFTRELWKARDRFGRELTDDEQATIAEAIAESMWPVRVKQEVDGLSVTARYHDPECECSVCSTNDRLGYDADVSDPGQYCKHGTFIGSWWGPEYMCGKCEVGYSAPEEWAEMRRIKARRNAVRPKASRTRIGTTTLSGIAAFIINQRERTARAQDRFSKSTGKYTERARVEVDRQREREHATTQAYWAILDDDQQYWLVWVLNGAEEKKAREDREANFVEMWTTSPKSMERVKETAPELYAQLRDGRTRSERLNPLAYETPRTNLRDALESQDITRDLVLRGFYGRTWDERQSDPGDELRALLEALS